MEKLNLPWDAEVFCMSTLKSAFVFIPTWNIRVTIHTGCENAIILSHFGMVVDCNVTVH
jgi:hypothetical protein